ncbi:unnamed protein product [Strongylus vulgaris]|uniref:Uncharacterized protein n=1 Tax=Strongylus vulgaris TaxID=40348 RepID=A0A3P7KIX1_STRVU|nr:unnamed protein product [Strongylus vulgaris]
MTTAEIIMSVQGTFKTAVIIKDAICKIKDTVHGVTNAQKHGPQNLDKDAMYLSVIMEEMRSWAFKDFSTLQWKPWSNIGQFRMMRITSKVCQHLC